MDEPDETTSTDDRERPSNGRDVDPLVEIAARLAELKAFAAHLAEVKIDQLRLWSRQMFAVAIVGALCAVAAVVLVATATIYIARGTALGLSEWMGDTLWLGYLLAGILLLTLTAVVGASLYLALDSRRKKQLIEKYDTRRDHQETDLGFTVDDAGPDADRQNDAGDS